LEERKNRDLALVRKSFQGIGNIIRFNWHFFALAITFLLLISGLSFFVSDALRFAMYGLMSLISLAIMLPLFFSFYIYDLSELYGLQWLNDIKISKGETIVNIHAGFDETSELIRAKFPNNTLKVFDFYNPIKHTEASIKRARKAYSPYEGTIVISTSALPLAHQEADYILIIFAAHEIRNDHERTIFFKELSQALSPVGKIIVVEHLRDLLNILVYNIGAMHFLSKSSWHRTFTSAGLSVSDNVCITPFVRRFVLEKNGNIS